MQTNLLLTDLLASLYEGCLEAIALYDRDGRLVSCNPAACRLADSTEEAMAGTHYHSHVRRAEHHTVDETFASALAGFVGHFETMMRTSSGAEVPVEVHLVPATRGAEIVGVFAQARDMIALHAAEEALELNQQRFRSLFEYHPEAIMALKSSGSISRVNVALEAVTGFYGEEIIGKDWSELIAPECREQALHAFRLACEGEASEFDSYLVDRSGNRTDVQMKLVPLRVAGRIDGAYAVAKNVAAQRSAERAMALQGERIRQLYLVAAARGDSIEAQIETTLALGCRLFDFDCAYLTRSDNAAIQILHVVGEGAEIAPGAVYPKSEPPWGAHFAARFSVGAGEFALVYTNADGRTTQVEESDRDLLHLMALFVAAAIERAEHAERIEQLAFYDSLTGLPNRVLFNDRIRQTIGAAKRYGRGFAVMYLDLDDFKEINDRFGHPAGDLVLKAVADRLIGTLRESDTVARFGGDEFVILQPVVNAEADASNLARKIIAVMQAPLQIDDFEQTVHASIGIALYPEHGTTTEELMEHADRALYRAKGAGRNQCQFYSC